jgi:hypothetical protein
MLRNRRVHLILAMMNVDRTYVMLGLGLSVLECGAVSTFRPGRFDWCSRCVSSRAESTPKMKAPNVDAGFRIVARRKNTSQQNEGQQQSSRRSIVFASQTTVLSPDHSLVEGAETSNFRRHIIEESTK